MKYKFLISLFIIIPLSTNCSDPQKVYICRSNASYAYHNKVCQGLRNCKHRVDTVTVSVAIKEGYKKPCGYCYRKGALNQILPQPKKESSVRKILID